MGLFDNVEVDENVNKVFSKTENKVTRRSKIRDTLNMNSKQGETNFEATNSLAPQGPTTEIAAEEPSSEISDSEEVIDAQTNPKSQVRRSEEDRLKSERTVFVGNVNNIVIVDKQAYKEFKTTFGSAGLIESIRFRSIAFSEMLPRKAAFIQQKLHPSRDAVNAYIVYKEKGAVTNALKLNAMVIQDHHLRVDSVSDPAEQDTKRSVFIGNLNFEATEEALWKFFESCGSVEAVRIVRDSKTNLGKGFAFVQFEDPSSTQVALMKNGAQLEGREIRVVRPSSKRANNPAARRLRQKESRNTKKPKQPKMAPVLEGQRAQKGQKASLGKKRRPRSSSGRVAKRSRKHTTSGGPN